MGFGWEITVLGCWAAQPVVLGAGCPLSLPRLRGSSRPVSPEASAAGVVRSSHCSWRSARTGLSRSGSGVLSVGECVCFSSAVPLLPFSLFVRLEMPAHGIVDLFARVFVSWMLCLYSLFVFSFQILGNFLNLSALRNVMVSHHVKFCFVLGIYCC